MPGAGEGVSGMELLPATAMASALGMLIFLSAARWWRFATRRRIGGLSLPTPTRWTFLSGLATAAIIATTTRRYSCTCWPRPGSSSSWWRCRRSWWAPSCWRAWRR